MTIKSDKVRANLVIDREFKKELEKIAVKENRSFNNLVITILKDFVSARED